MVLSTSVPSVRTCLLPPLWSYTSHPDLHHTCWSLWNWPVHKYMINTGYECKDPLMKMCGIFNKYRNLTLLLTINQTCIQYFLNFKTVQNDIAESKFFCKDYDMLLFCVSACVLCFICNDILIFISHFSFTLFLVHTFQLSFVTISPGGVFTLSPTLSLATLSLYFTHKSCFYLRYLYVLCTPLYSRYAYV